VRTALAVLVSLVPLSGAAQAQTGEAASKNLTLLGIPSGTVAPRGLAFGSLSLTDNRVGPGPREDGSLAFGLGFGSAETGVGVQLTAFITSLTDDFGDSGYFEIKASRRIMDGQSPTYVALTLGGAGFGDASGRDTSATLALTSFRQIRFSDSGPVYPVMFTLGAGTNERNLERDPAIFGGVGIGVSKNLGLSVAWSGEYVNLGAALRFDDFENFGMTATLHDAFDQEDSRRFDVSFTYFLKDLF